MSSRAKLLADQMEGSRDWTLRLVADVEHDDWLFQPFGGGHHILWLCGHLAVAEHLLVITRCLEGDPPDAEFAAHFAIGQPIKSRVEHNWPTPAAVREKMDATHGEVIEAIRDMSDSVLDKPAYGLNGAEHPHYKTVAGAVAHCSRHEGFHAGQIAMLRRLRGKSFLR